MSPSEHNPASLAHLRTFDDGQTAEHGLGEHLHEVARLAAHHAAPFGGANWACVAGQWHDLGKYRRGFQSYIRSASLSDGEAETAHIEGRLGRISHSTWLCYRFLLADAYMQHAEASPGIKAGSGLKRG